MIIVIEREIPDFVGFWARNDGTITKPSGKNTRGCLDSTKDRYRVKINQNTYYVHRLICSAWNENLRPDLFYLVDHIDRNAHNNCPGNLRFINKTLNQLNNGGYNCHFCEERMRWRARCSIRGKKVRFGSFKTFLEAYRVGQANKRAEFARLFAELTRNPTPCLVSVCRQ